MCSISASRNFQFSFQSTFRVLSILFLPSHILFSIVVVVLLFYIHGKVMSGRSVNLTTLFLGRIRPPKPLTSASCTHFRQ